MSNLVEIAKDLEYVPDEQLVELANGSDPRFPPFVVISEIKRRTDMRNRASEPMPKTTVAQEMVQEFAMPSRQGLEGMSQDATGILPPTVYNRDMPSSNMADGGLVGYATGDETKYRGKINQLVGAKLGPTNPKTLDESMSRLERYRKSQQIGRLINDPNHPLNKFFRYIPDGQQMSNYLLGRRGEDFTPDVRRATDKPMDKKQEGGLTGYQTGNQTALTNTFLYTPSIEGNVPFSEQGLYRLLEERGIDSKEEQQEISKILSSGLARFTQPRDIQIAGVLKSSDDFLAQPKVDSPLGRMSDRRSFAQEILEGVSPGPKVPEDFTPPKDDSKGDTPSIDGDTLPDDKPSKLAVEEAEKKKFANMDVDIPERTQRPRTEAEMKQQLNADVLMTVGTAIGSSATPSEIFQKLSGLPAQLAASRKEQRKEVRDFESDRRADALQKLNIQIALKKIDQAEEKARLKGDANDIAAINAIADVLTGTLDTNSKRYKSAERALDSIIAKLSGKETNKGIAALSELLIPAES